MHLPSGHSPEYRALQRKWARRFPGRSLRDVEPADEYRVERFAGGEIGGTNRFLMDYHVCDSRGRTVRVFPKRGGNNAAEKARVYARKLNVHLARERMLA